MRIVFVGPPGAGKGTQAQRLAGHVKVPHLSTGDILRAAKSAGTALGKKVAPIMDAGGLVSDELMVQVVNERLLAADCQTGFLLDGFPRTIPQAESLDTFLLEHGWSLDHVVELRVSDEELTRRLLERFEQLAQPRADDTPEAIPNRLHLYHTETQPLLDFYARRPELLKSVDGIGSIDGVFQRIAAAVGN